jgi:hypothetical protein
MMEPCGLTGETGCKKIRMDVDIRYYPDSVLHLGTTEGVSKNCMCVNTRMHFPLNSKIKIVVPFNKDSLNVPVSVNNFLRTNDLNDTMSVEVANPTKEYLEFVDSLAVTV